MATENKKALDLCGAIVGNEFETYEDFKNELIRRNAVLDFLALYIIAKEDKVVERVKHIIHANKFLDHNPQHWEQYLTRLLGRCLRSHCPGHQAVEKERNSFVYNVYIHRDYPHLKKILDMKKLVSLDYPWYLHGSDMVRYRQDPCLYWRTRGLIEPTEVDAMFAAWNRFSDAAERCDRIQMSGSVIKVSYGFPGYVGQQRRWYRTHNNPAYHTYEAYIHFKNWMRLAEEFVGNDAPFDTFRILNDHNRSDDWRIERELRENAGREMELIRERARAAARRRTEEDAVVNMVPVETPLATQLIARLRQRGLVDDA